MRFFCDDRVRSVLKSSCIIHTLRFCARLFLAIIAMDGMYAGFAGAKASHEKITIFRGTPSDLIELAIPTT